MRRFGAIWLAAFYLLLTTGSFACLMHCTEAYLLNGANLSEVINGDDPELYSERHHEKESHSSHKAHQDTKKDNCAPGKDCNCCKKHGLYVVSENFRPTFEFLTTAVALPLKDGASYDSLVISQSLKDLVPWPHDTGPPVGYGPPIYIKVRSLLI